MISTVLNPTSQLTHSLIVGCGNGRGTLLATVLPYTTTVTGWPTVLRVCSTVRSTINTLPPTWCYTPAIIHSVAIPNIYRLAHNVKMFGTCDAKHVGIHSKKIANTYINTNSKRLLRPQRIISQAVCQFANPNCKWTILRDPIQQG